MIALLLLLQDTAELLDRLDAAPVPFEAAIRVARDRRDADRTAVLAGRITREADYRLRVDVRGLETGVLPELVVWRRPWKELRAAYSILADRAASEPDLPAAVVDAQGAAIPPVKVRLRRDVAAAPEGDDGRDGRVVLRLTPRDAKAGPRLRVWVDPASARVVKVASDTRTQATVITLDGFREPGPAEGPRLDHDTGVRSEDPE